MKGVDGSGGWLLENNEPRHGSKDEFDKNALHTDTKSAILEFCSGGRLFFFSTKSVVVWRLGPF